MIRVQKLESSIRKVYHDPVQIEEKAPEVSSNPFLRHPVSTFTDISSDLSESKPKEVPVLPAKENFVRLNLKRHLNVKHRPHKRNSTHEEEISDNIIEPSVETPTSAGVTEEEMIELATSSSHETPVDDIPLCHHGIPAVLRVVRKSGKNHGREFYCCCHDRLSSCHFFLWRENNRADILSFLSSSNSKEDPTDQPKKDTFMEFQKLQLEKLSVVLKVTVDV